jgi:peptide chain release factor-like protein
MHPASLAPPALLLECVVRRQRRSGPGGQHRNKVETGIVLLHQPSGIQAEASERRSQAQNLKMAIQRLRTKLAVQIRSPRSARPYARSLLWQSRVKGRRILVSAAHQDFPALLAEALDRLAACEFDLLLCCQQLLCSSSQLVKFLQQEPEALLLVNRDRAKRELRPLR